MTEQKKPKAGEWWRLKSGGGLLFVIGTDAAGDAVAHDSERQWSFIDSFWWEHLPDCTGFDWVPEPVESPDDWVTQDRVPPRPLVDSIYIPGVNQWAWSRVQKTDVVTLKHGEKICNVGPIQVRCRRKDLPPIPTTRTIKLCTVVYWDLPEYPMSTILTEQELDRYRKAWRALHVVSETTVEVPL